MQGSDVLVFVDVPEELLLRMDHSFPMPLGLESVVVVDVEGVKFEACVPARAVLDQDPIAVYGQYVGMKGDDMVVVFPPSSMGTSVWYLSREVLDTIKLEEVA